MYIGILDYLKAEIVVVEVDDSTDVEDYVSSNFGLGNVEYMAIDEIKLKIYKD